MTEEELQLERLALDRRKAQLDEDRFAFEKQKYKREDLFLRRNSVAMISASVALVGLLFSGSQAYTGYRLNKQQSTESALSRKAQAESDKADRERQYKLSIGQLLMENFERFRSSDQGDILLIRNVIISSFPPDLSQDFLTKMALISHDDTTSKLWAAGVFLSQSLQAGNDETFATLDDALAYFSVERVGKIVPNAKDLPTHLKVLVAAFYNAGYKSRSLLAGILANIIHETAGLRSMREYWGPTTSQKQYEGRADLGNTQPGDGKLFMGRGYVQIVGRANYQKYSPIAGVDLVAHPQLAEEPETAAKIAVSLFNSRLDPNGSPDIVKMRRLINGGANGLADVQSIYTELLSE